MTENEDKKTIPKNEIITKKLSDTVCVIGTEEVIKNETLTSWEDIEIPPHLINRG